MLTALAAFAAVPHDAAAETWLLKAQWQATCLDKADDAERAALGVQWAPDTTAIGDAEMRTLRAYVTGAGSSGDERLFRYLTLLGAFSYQANYSNDQELRQRLDAQLLLHARESLSYERPTAPTQVHLCMHARLIESLIESRDLAGANLLAAALARHYPQLPVSAAATDWPLVAALRAVATAPEGLEGALDDLGAAAVSRAAALEPVAPHRASRLYAAAAPMPLLLGGDPRQALQVAARASAVVPASERAAATWRAFPALYDAIKVTEAREPPTAAALTESLFASHGFPESSADRRTNFEVLVRITEVYRDLGRDSHDFWVLAYDELVALNNGHESLAFLRGALARLAAATDRPVDALLHWRAREAAAPATELDKARELYDFLLDQRRKSVVIDARTQLFTAFIGESILYSLSRLAATTPVERRARDDLSFRVLLLDSFTRISVAAAAAGLQHLDASLTDSQRFQLERFYTYMGQHSTWVSGGADRVWVETGAPLPPAETLWDAFMVTSIFQHETTAALDEYYSVLERGAPRVAAMTIPYAVPLAEFQARLRAGQAVVGTVAGLHESYVWAIANDRVGFERVDRTAAELGATVAALRASVTARGTGGVLEVPAFDAAAAFELYRATVGRVAPALAGIEHVFWYGDGALGAVPPAILVTAEPRNPKPSTQADFAGIEFFVDRYASSSLPDLYLGKTEFLKPARTAARAATFVGIGAPLLSRDELAQRTLSSSFELAGGTDIGDLRNLAKLPASRDELETLGAMFERSLLWLGEDASEARLKATPLTDYRVIAFATHGFTRTDIEGALYPSLLLAPPPEAAGSDDGLLSTLEIGELTLDADLVLLSACNTATSDGRPDAEAFSGLAQAFLVAGAHSLLVSHWPVASGAASRLSVATVEGWLGGATLATSLRQSMQALRDDAGTDLEAHPFFWGPFVLADDGASALAAAP